MSSATSPLLKLLQRLSSRGVLDHADQVSILALPYEARTYEANSYLIREGGPPNPFCSFVSSGFAFRQKLTVQGARQIVSIHMAGDFLDLQHLFLKRADHNVQALTRLETVMIERSALRALAAERPAVGEAMWVDALVEASIFREWITNVGRRDARTRIAHLLCEFATRMTAAGLSDGERYELPMTQEQIGDATGLTSVHVNRTLKSLQAEGLVHRQKGFLSFEDWERIRSVADFSSLYLHLDQSTPRPV